METGMNIELEALKKRLYAENGVKNIKFYPGSYADAEPEDMAREINKFFAEAANAEIDPANVEIAID
jgi:endonuclease IV